MTEGASLFNWISAASEGDQASRFSVGSEDKLLVCRGHHEQVLPSRNWMSFFLINLDLSRAIEKIEANLATFNYISKLCSDCQVDLPIGFFDCLTPVRHDLDSIPTKFRRE